VVQFHHHEVSTMPDIDIRKLKAELARQGSTLTALALRTGTKVSTFSAWVHGVREPPPDLVRRVAKTLGIPPGSITSRHTGAGKG
jgi:transcriptional regulator with XRE-family HTH domain